MRDPASAFQFPELSGDTQRSTARVAPQAAIMLALTFPVSSSTARPEDSWASVFDQSTSVYNSPVSERLRPVAPVERVVPLTAEQLGAVHSFFGLSKTQLAQVCQVQRQTIYDWYASNFEAEGKNAGRLLSLYTLVETLRAEGRGPLSARVVKRPLASGATLLELLTRDDIPNVEVVGVVARLDQATSQLRTQSAAATLNRLGWGAPSRDTTTKTLSANLDDFTDG